MEMIKTFIFQRGNDPKHTANIVSIWFVENNIQVVPLVGQSPNMKQSEYIWDNLE